VQIYILEEFLFKIDGICKFCNSIFNGNLINQPEEGRRVIIRCTMEGPYIYNAQKENKRRIIGEKKEYF